MTDAGSNLKMGPLVKLNVSSLALEIQSLPSQAHLDLFKAGIINDPLLEFTERWVINDNWTYTADLTPFTKNHQGDTSKRTLIVFYGIDTIGNITFSGYPAFWVNNQFRRYSFDISHFLNSSIGDDHNLTIALESAWHYGLNATIF
ncbi:hypothetical protein P692DRAFT_20876773 [Suillus brevipes Sb2]|nr:hypothetical protein P692DRAFT_20876773 [Suillus brevipes Sb2]